MDRSSRLHYLDWLRGLAAVVMLQGHTFHSFTRPDLREGSPYVLSQYLGGIPPAIFLFLTGVTLAFRMNGNEKRNLPAWDRVRGALDRAGYLMAIAFLFRLQLWAFSWPYGSWTDIFKVDILNCMALAIVVLSVTAVFSTADRVRMGAVLGLVITAASPLISRLDWAGVPWLVRNYLVPDYNYFSFFPWAAFLAFGVSAGSVIRLLSDEQMDRAMQWASLLGAMLIVGGRYFAEIPYSLYPSTEFWLNSPALALIKLGVLLWMLAAAFLWTRYAAGPGWSWIRQLGTTSLLVYWVHIELVYGRWLSGWKENLNTIQTVAATGAVILLMLAVSTAKTSCPNWGPRLAALRWSPLKSSRAAGD